jgi:hypothetical protein
MGKFARRSRDQKRKAKLKKRLTRSPKHESLAYHGGKYKTAEFVRVIHRTETGIFEIYVSSERRLTDDEVEAALESLIRQMREGSLPPLEDRESTGDFDGNPTDVLIWNIRRNWQIYAESDPLPRRDDLIGVLRTILGSLETWRSKSMDSRGYLNFLEGFLKKTGVTVELIKEGAEDELEEEEDEDEDEDEKDVLLSLGREWIEAGDKDAAADFAEEIKMALQGGEAQLVVDVCEQLIGENTDKDKDVVSVLQAFAVMGHQALQNQGNPQPAKRPKWFPGW